MFFKSYRFDKFYYMDKFTDKNGNLDLADKQKKHFGGNSTRI